MPKIITFPRITDARGSLSFAQELPFNIRRAYWLFDLSSDAVRGGHSHRRLERVIIPISGSVIATVNGQPYHLYKPWVGLHVLPLEWLDLNSFSGGAALMVLASAIYDERDYIRDRADYDKLISASTTR